LYLLLPAICVVVAAAAAWLLPSVKYVQAQVARYELRYVEGVGNVEYPAGSQMARVRQFDWPPNEVALGRMRGYLIGGTLTGLLAGAAIHLRSRRLYKNGRRLYFKDGDLLPITGEPMQGELLPPIRGIGVKDSPAGLSTMAKQS